MVCLSEEPNPYLDNVWTHKSFCVLVLPLKTLLRSFSSYLPRKINDLLIVMKQKIPKYKFSLWTVLLMPSRRWWGFYSAQRSLIYNQGNSKAKINKSLIIWLISTVFQHAVFISAQKQLISHLSHRKTQAGACCSQSEWCLISDRWKQTGE